MYKIRTMVVENNKDSDEHLEGGRIDVYQIKRGIKNKNNHNQTINQICKTVK